MGILINRQLTRDQYIKLFSNPVSGLACTVVPPTYGYEITPELADIIKNIRYSKSMILGALNFWKTQLLNYYFKVKSIYNPLNSIYIVRDLEGQLAELSTRIIQVGNCPDSFLFSHRYIQEEKEKNKACILLDKKYKDIIFNNGFRPQKGTLDPYMPAMSTTGIYFTIFANEHPYIPRQKISKVGMTDRGNIYVLHKKRNGV